MQKPLILNALLCCALCAGLMAVDTSAQAVEPTDIQCVISTKAEHDTTVMLTTEETTTNLYLPAASDLHSIVFNFKGEKGVLSSGEKSVRITSGKACDITDLFDDGYAPKSSGQSMTLTVGKKAIKFTMFQSQCLASVYLSSPDYEHNREWVEKSKENKAKDGGIVILRKNGSILYDGTLSSLKGRGNSTWGYEKKPYQIKLDKAVDVMETGDSSESNKTWVLLANYCDPTLLHNTFTFAMAKEMGLLYTPNSRFVDLYYDGDYRGCYQLSEKTEVGEGRVEINDLESDILKKSGVEDASELDTKQAKTENGILFQYVNGLSSPSNIKGGYLLEMDYEGRAKAEKSWFKTLRGQFIVSKSPEYLTKQSAEYISSLYQHFEDAVYNGGKHPTTGKDYTYYVDLDSLARCYLLLELSQDCDAFLSSTYFFKPEDSDKLYAGPVWDFDSAYGVSDTKLSIRALQAGTTGIGEKLLEIPSFRNEVAEAYAEVEGLVRMIALNPSSAASGEYVHSIQYESEILSRSRIMDSTRWSATLEDYSSYEQAIEEFKDFLNKRNQFLYTYFGNVESTVTYSDVKPNLWYTDSVMSVTSQGLLTGTGSSTFSPTATVTRGMLLTILYRMAGQPYVGEQSPFSDVTEDRFYHDAVVWARYNEITFEEDTSEFRPDEAVTRQDMAMFLWQFAKNPCSNYDLDDFKDSDEIKAEARPGVRWVCDTHLMVGNNGEFRPTGNATRAELAVILERLSKSVA